MHNYNYANKSNNEREFEQIEVKNSDIINDSPVKENNNVPKTYAHSLTEIRILFKAKDRKEEKMIGFLLANLNKRISEMNHENIDNRDKIEHLQEELTRNEAKREDLIKKNKKLEAIFSQNCSFESKERKKSNNYELVMENVKLGQLNSAYLSKINDLESCKN